MRVIEHADEQMASDTPLTSSSSSSSSSVSDDTMMSPLELQSPPGVGGDVRVESPSDVDIPPVAE